MKKKQEIIWTPKMKAKAILQARQKMNMTQEEFAPIMLTNNMTLCRWETGNRAIHEFRWRYFLDAVCMPFGISFDKKGVIR